jgi:UDP-N-acetyl-D-glucosamine dehydrogenase
MIKKLNDTKMEKLIKQKKAKVTIIGLGYVGLPHAVEIAKAGFFVSGIDIQKNRVDKVNKGISYIKDIESEELKKVVIKKKLKAFNDFSPIKKADIVIICVPTPLDKYKIPDISYIESSVGEIKKRMISQKLIVLESTTYPGTTEEVILPLLQQKNFLVGKDFYLAFAPERIDPGNETPFHLIPKVVGGVTNKCTLLAKTFYSQFLRDVHTVSSPKVAEMTKILENTYRLINVSAINELSLLCGKMEIDIWEVIEAAKTKPYGFQPFYPSPKIGGHCIPLDPFYLSWKAKEYNFWSRFIELAGEINEQRPHYVVTKAISALNKKNKSVKNSKILIWGAAYKKDIADSRESAIYDIAHDLIGKGSKVCYFDPYVKEIVLNKKQKFGKIFKLKTIKYSPFIFNKYDLVIILTDHTGFDYEKIAKESKLIVDTRNAIKSRNHKNVYWL